MMNRFWFNPFFWIGIYLTGYIISIGVLTSPKASNIVRNKMPKILLRIFILLIFILPPAILPFTKGPKLNISTSFALIMGILFLGINFIIKILAQREIGVSPALKNKGKLIITGIYKIIRHPSYVSNMLLALGMAILFKSIYALLFSIAYALLYLPIIYFEEKNLSEEYGEEYEKYKRKVGMVFPKIKKKGGMMKEIKISLLILGIIAMPGILRGDVVTGCPLGLNKGELWLRSLSGYMYATKALWNETPSKEPEMVNLPEGWHAWVVKSGLSISYGITQNLDIGMLTNYFQKDIKREVWAKTPKGQKRKEKEIKGQGFGDLWLSAKYKFLFQLVRGSLRSYALGMGIRLDMSDNSLVAKGIGTGAKAMRGVALAHQPLPLGIDLCGDIWYEYQGKVREFEIRNEKGEMVEWKKSGWDLGDKIGYRFNFEYPLTHSGKFQTHLMAIGWMKLKDRDKNGEEVNQSNRYEHSLMVKFVFMPEEENKNIQKLLQAHHRKVFMGVKVPLAVRNDFSSSFIPMLGLMWTF